MDVSGPWRNWCWIVLILKRAFSWTNSICFKHRGMCAALPFKSAADPSLGEQPAVSNISKAAKAFLRVFDAAAAEFLCPVWKAARPHWMWSNALAPGARNGLHSPFMFFISSQNNTFILNRRPGIMLYSCACMCNAVRLAAAWSVSVCALHHTTLSRAPRGREMSINYNNTHTPTNSRLCRRTPFSAKMFLLKTLPGILNI